VLSHRRGKEKENLAQPAPIGIDAELARTEIRAAYFLITGR
jgi:hypothetical protein